MLRDLEWPGVVGSNPTRVVCLWSYFCLLDLERHRVYKVCFVYGKNKTSDKLYFVCTF